MRSVPRDQLQLPLPFNSGAEDQRWELFPRTRYLGSKRKLLGLLAEIFGQIDFDTALDPFSGTGAVAYLLKTMDKEVTACDLLASNVIAARALVQNDKMKLGTDTDGLLSGLPGPDGPAGFVEK